jgi:hypothetical protein
MLCTDLRTNSDYFRVELYSTETGHSSHSRVGAFLLNGMNFNLNELTSSKGFKISK